MATTQTFPRTGKGGYFVPYPVLRLNPGKTEFTIGSTVKLMCAYGYEAPANDTSTLVERNGVLVWEPPEIHCERVLHLLPTTGPGGAFKPVGNAKRPYRKNDRVELECARGYIRPAVFYVSKVVMKNGELAWEPDELYCNPVQCMNPPDVPFGRTSNKSYRFDTTFQYVCDRGYVFDSPINGFRCDENGQWDPPIPKTVACVPIECPEFAVQNATVNYYQFRGFGSTASVQCNDGYARSSGDAVRTCQADGTWDGLETVCVRKTDFFGNKLRFIIFGIVVLFFICLGLLLKKRYSVLMVHEKRNEMNKK